MSGLLSFDCFFFPESWDFSGSSNLRHVCATPETSWIFCYESLSCLNPKENVDLSVLTDHLTWRGSSHQVRRTFCGLWLQSQVRVQRLRNAVWICSAYMGALHQPGWWPAFGLSFSKPEVCCLGTVTARKPGFASPSSHGRDRLWDSAVSVPTSAF